MMRRALGRLLAAGLALPATAGVAQDEGGNPLHAAVGAPDDLTIHGSIRPRIEAIDGQFRPDTAPEDELFSIRTALAVEWRPGNFRIGGELWDVRGYAQNRDSSVRTGEVNAFEPIQAYVGYDLDDGETSVTAGRFTQDIGARRFMARQRFRNSTNTFTGAKVNWTDDTGNSAILFWTMAQRILPNDAARIRDNEVVLDHFGTDLQFFGAVLTKDDAIAGGQLEIEGFALLEDDTQRFATTNRQLFTPAIRLSRAPSSGMLDWDVEAAYQTGTARRTDAPSDTQDLRVSAYFLHAGLGYTFAVDWSPRILLAYDLASGDGGDGQRLTRFDTLFGARRELGPTDLYGLLQRANLISPEIRLLAQPGPRLDGYVSVRPAWLEDRRDSFAASGVQDASGNSGRYAGTQVEALARYAIVPSLIDLEAGGVYLAKGRFLTEAPNAPSTGDTVYGYANVTFSF